MKIWSIFFLQVADSNLIFLFICTQQFTSELYFFFVIKMGGRVLFWLSVLKSNMSFLLFGERGFQLYNPSTNSIYFRVIHWSSTTIQVNHNGTIMRKMIISKLCWFSLLLIEKNSYCVCTNLYLRLSIWMRTFQITLIYIIKWNKKRAIYNHPSNWHILLM
jgi:hypothetical protein